GDDHYQGARSPGTAELPRRGPAGSASRDDGLNGKTKTRLRGSVSAITACFVHSQAAAHLMMSANAARAAGVFSFHMVHDNYGTTAADAPMLARVLRRAFVDMYDDTNDGHPTDAP